MENLKKNIIAIIILELITLIAPIALKTNNSYFPFWMISVFAINVLSIVFLLRFRPKNYGFLILALLTVIFGPILFIFYELSQVQC